MSDLYEDLISQKDLLFDPNNYRFQDLDNFVYAAEERFHEDTVQRRAYQRMRQEEGIQALKNSILRNGYLSVERIVVRPYHHSTPQKWVVVEGNRRLAAVRWILEDYEGGVPIAPQALLSIEKLPAVVAEKTAPDEVFRASLMGIRHVSGTKQWGGYQRAKLVMTMRDELGLDAGEVAERLAMSTQEVNRRYRAFKTLNQMQNDEDYGGYAKHSMYPLFHEAVSLPVVREWLGWSDEKAEFIDIQNLHKFYDLITPTELEEEGRTIEAKIATYSQVRELRSILPKLEAQRILLDPNRTFQDAINVAKQEELFSQWASEVAATIRSLENIGIKELKMMSNDDVAMLEKLRQVIDERLQDHKSLVVAEQMT